MQYGMPGWFSSEILLFLQSGEYPISTSSVVFFRIGFGVSLLLKQIVETSRNHPKHVATSSYVYQSHLKASFVRRSAHHIYSKSFALRWIFIVLFLFGITPRLSSAALAVSYGSELFCLFRYHALMAFFVMSFLGCDSGFAMIPTLMQFPQIAHITGKKLSLPSILFIKTLVIFMYLSGVLRKLQNSFYDASVLREGGLFSLHAEGRRFPDHPHRSTKKLLELVIAGTRAKTVATSVIFIQLTVGICLLVGGPAVYLAVILGTALHAGITLLFPITLCFFSLMMLSTYLLWIFPS